MAWVWWELGVRVDGAVAESIALLFCYLTYPLLHSLVLKPWIELIYVYRKEQKK